MHIRITEIVYPFRPPLLSPRAFQSLISFPTQSIACRWLYTRPLNSLRFIEEHSLSLDKSSITVSLYMAPCLSVPFLPMTSRARTASSSLQCRNVARSHAASLFLCFSRGPRKTPKAHGYEAIFNRTNIKYTGVIFQTIVSIVKSTAARTHNEP